jgi:DNA-directed RNA polymerase subunit RPC12/RpoP
MKCPNCGAENREESNFCRYCSYRLAAAERRPNSGYVPSVPPPEAASFREQYPPVQQQQSTYQQPPAPPAPYVWGQHPCPRCGALSVTKGATPVWAIVLAIVLALPTCFLSLFFLMIKDPNRCLNCGLEFR